MLREAVQQHMAENVKDATQCRVVVRVFADMKLLTQLEDCDVYDFAAGFSAEGSFFDFVGIKNETAVGSRIAGKF